MVEIREFTLDELRRVRGSRAFFAGDRIPVVRHRLGTYLNNPRAEPGDVLLLVATDRNRLVGHTAILPDWVWTMSRRCRVGWVSSLWRDPDPALKGLGSALVESAAARYDGMLAAAGCSPASIKVFDRIPSLRRVRDYDHTLLQLRPLLDAWRQPRLRSLKAAACILAPLEWCAQRAWGVRVAAWARGRRLPPEAHYHYGDCIDAEAEDFIERHRQPDLTRRGRSELEWIYQHPGVLVAPRADVDEARYHFASSAFAGRFDILLVKIAEPQDRQLLGVALLTHRDGRVKAPYVFYRQQSSSEFFFALIRQVLGLGAASFETDNAVVLAGIQATGYPFFRKFRSPDALFLPRSLGDVDPGLLLQDGDGDRVFY